MTLSMTAAAIAGRFLAARRAAAGLDDYPGDFPATLDEAYRDPGRGDRRLGPPGHRLEGRPHRRAADRPLRHRPARRPDLRTETLAPTARSRNAGLRRGLRRRRGRIPAADRRARRRRARPSFTLDEARRPDRRRPCRHRDRQLAARRDQRASGPIAVVSDFGNNNGLVVGPEIPDWRTSGFEQWPVTLPDRRRASPAPAGPRPSRTARSAPRASCSS